MLKIACCDDMLDDRNDVMYALTQIEQNLGTEFEISFFNCGENLCESLKINSYDVILLDIVMDGIDGIETAKNIYSMDVDSYIIFISSYDEKVKNLFGEKTLAFLDKPVKADELQTVIKKVYTLIKKEDNNIFTYKDNKVEKFVYLKNIIYIESKGRKVEIITTLEKIVINETMKNIWSVLQKSDYFLMLNRSYIVNLKYAKMINSNTFNIQSYDLDIKIGRTMKSDVEQRYFNFIRRI